MQCARQSRPCELGHNRIEVADSNLDDRAEFFVEELADRRSREIVEVDIESGSTGKGHFDECRKETPVRTIVVGEQRLAPDEGLDRFEKGSEFRRVVDIRCFVADGRKNLGERRGTEPIAAQSQVD